MKRVLCFSMLLMFGLSVFACNPTIGQDVTITVKPVDDTTKPFQGKRPSVDVAILLDTSNSMDGLIHQARAQLWNIVQQFANAEKAGQTPVLRVAVMEYGNSGLPASEGYIRKVVPLTTDLDRVSKGLFELKTSGGDEYCGLVIHEATKRLDWSKSEGGYKAIFIAGNEPFTQGEDLKRYSNACIDAIEKGIIVNTIHCGSYQDGVRGKWQVGAELGAGKFLNINQDRKVVHVKAPQDKIIIELNRELNDTYLWYGSKQEQERFCENQKLQDDNALRQSGGAGFSKGRAQTKASSLYDNFGRDLVDTLKQDKEILKRLKEDHLPEKLQKLNVKERAAYIEQMAKKRALIQEKIVQNSKARDEYIAKNRKEQAVVTDSFGAVVNSAIMQQLESNGFKVKK